MNQKVNLIQIEEHGYVSRTQNLLEQILREGIATYIGKIEYPRWLGSAKEILHINQTTVTLSYSPCNPYNRTVLKIHGINEDILRTKELLEQILKEDLIRSK